MKSKPCKNAQISQKVSWDYADMRLVPEIIDTVIEY